MTVRGQGKSEVALVLWSILDPKLWHKTRRVSGTR